MIQSKNALYDIISDLCEKNKESIATMCKESGIRPGLMSDLKSGRASSLSMESLVKIADHFKVSMDVLFGR